MMEIGVTHTELEEIDRVTCEELLRSEQIGRLGVVVAGRPEIFPVNYSVDEVGAVVFDTVPGMKLAGALNHHVVFEVDHPVATGTNRGTGWSVVVHGVAHQTSAASLRFLGRRPRSWLDGRTQTVRINPTSITGRRLAPAPEEG